MDYKALKVQELKELLKNKKLSVSGNKGDLIQRLLDSDIIKSDIPIDVKQDNYKNLKAQELKVLLKNKKLSVSGNKGDLIQRLLDSDMNKCVPTLIVDQGGVNPFYINQY